MATTKTLIGVTLQLRDGSFEVYCGFTANEVIIPPQGTGVALTYYGVGIDQVMWDPIAGHVSVELQTQFFETADELRQVADALRTKGWEVGEEEEL